MTTGDMALKLVIAIVVLAHGAGHVLFLAPALGLVDWAGQTSQSWLLTATIGETATRAIAALVWSAALILFVAGVAGFLSAADWWRTVTVAGALVSGLGVVLMWGGISTASAAFALGFDALVLVALLWARWPSAELAGS
jgi:hypothetical protein